MTTVIEEEHPDDFIYYLFDKCLKKYITTDEAIKSLGNYSAIVDFGDEITAKVKVKVNAE